MPPVAPPRTSSNQRQSGAALAAAATASEGQPERSSRKRQPDDRAIHAARMAASGDGAAPDTYGENRQTNGYREKSYDQPSSRPSSSHNNSRQRQQAPAERQRSSRGQPQRSDAHTNGVNDTADILSRVVISQPDEDIQRERERVAEAIPQSQKYATEPSINMNDGAHGHGVQEEQIQHSPPGERRRQDHSQSKKEKSTRFGEYYLGNTLGEGEFGKVKMGWKQEGGVQVSCHTQETPYVQH